MKPGRSLEKLVQQIEQALAQSDDITVESPKKLRDRTTGRLREHDVVITIHQHHHSLLIALECRDRSRPVGVAQIEAFWTKCQDTGIDQGIIVSPKGFYGTSLNKPEARGIRCFTMEQAAKLDWLQASNLGIQEEQVTRVSLRIVPQQQITNTTGDYVLVDKHGNEIPKAILLENARQRLTSTRMDPNKPLGHNKASFLFHGEGVYLYDRFTGTTAPIA